MPHTFQEDGELPDNLFPELEDGAKFKRKTVPSRWQFGAKAIVRAALAFCIAGMIFILTQMRTSSPMAVISYPTLARPTVPAVITVQAYPTVTPGGILESYPRCTDVPLQP